MCKKWAHNSCAGIDSEDDEAVLVCELSEELVRDYCMNSRRGNLWTGEIYCMIVGFKGSKLQGETQICLNDDEPHNQDQEKDTIKTFRVI